MRKEEMLTELLDKKEIIVGSRDSNRFKEYLNIIGVKYSATKTKKTASIGNNYNSDIDCDSSSLSDDVYIIKLISDNINYEPLNMNKGFVGHILLCPEEKISPWYYATYGAIYKYRTEIIINKDNHALLKNKKLTEAERDIYYHIIDISYETVKSVLDFYSVSYNHALLKEYSELIAKVLPYYTNTDCNYEILQFCIYKDEKILDTNLQSKINKIKELL